MKAVLVIDMPEIDENTKNGCRNCRYARKRMTLSEDYLCSITEQQAYVYDMKCPLKPLPKMKDVNEEIVKMFNIGVRDEKSQAAISNQVRGYNWCIDEILGETK